MNDLSIRILSPRLLTRVLQRREGSIAALARHAPRLFRSSNSLIEGNSPSLSLRYVDLALRCIYGGDGRRDELTGAMYKAVSLHLTRRDPGSLSRLAETIESTSTLSLDYKRWHYLSLGLCSLGAFVPAFRAFQKSIALRSGGAPTNDGLHEISDLVVRVEHPEYAYQRQAIREIVHKKHVALVGAAPLSGSSSRVVAESDVVVQTKFHPTFSRRIANAAYRISYLNGKMERVLVEDPAHLSAFLEAHETSAFWLVTKSTPHPRIEHMAAPGEGSAREILGPAMIGHKAMADLLLCEPRRLSLHGFNLYSTERRHDDASWTRTFQRERGVQHNVLRDCRALGQHQVFGHQQFMSSIYNSGFVDGDEETTAIMTMTGLDLALRLQDQLGIQTWI